MCAGGVLAYLVLIPAIKFFGESATAVLAPGTVPISQMDPDAIRSAYVLYIGAGAVAAGGIISLFRSLPTIWHGIKGWPERSARQQTSNRRATPRTDQDLSMKIVIGGCLALVAVMMIVPQLSLQWNVLGALLIVGFGFLFVTVSSRLTGEIGSSSNPISGMTVATLLLTCLVFLFVGWTGPQIFCHRTFHRRHRLHRLLQRRHDFAGFEDRFPCRLDAEISTDRHPRRRARFRPRARTDSAETERRLHRLRAGDDVSKIESGATPPRVQSANLPPFTDTLKPDTTGHYRILKNEKGGVNSVVPGLEPGEYLVNDAGEVVYKMQRNFPADLRAPNDAELGAPERIKGAQANMDPQSYRPWQRLDPGGRPRPTLPCERSGRGDLPRRSRHQRHPSHTRPDGSSVEKFDAPKATLMSYIIKGILSRKLPWALVLLGVMIAIVLEMSGIPSLAFAVGVYLPLSSSSPIFIGGMMRWLVDRYLRKQKFKDHDLSHDELVAEGDKSPGVLLASGYIAGGALAGIVIAFMAGVPSLVGIRQRLEEWSTAHNPFFHGANADLLALIPFGVLCVLLYLVGRDVLLAPQKGKSLCSRVGDPGSVVAPGVLPLLTRRDRGHRPRLQDQNCLASAARFHLISPSQNGDA